MQRSGTATRRFYAAFYWWTVRSAAAHTGGPAAARRCVGTRTGPGSTLGARRRQSTGTGFISYVERGWSRTTQTQPGPHASGHAKGFIRSTELLRNAPVQSTTDRPSDSLKAWDYAVRGKSRKSVTVEIAVPRWLTRDKDIAKRAEVHEVVLSTPATELRDDATDDDVCSVFLSGDFSDVKAVWKHIHTTGSPNVSDEPIAAKEPAEPIELYQPSPAKHQLRPIEIEKEFSLPEPFWQPIGKKGATEYFQTQHGVHVQMSEASAGLLYMRLRGSERQVREVNKFLERVREWALEDKHEEMRRNASEKGNKEVVAYEELGSDGLEVWQSVTRRLEEGKIEEEICLPELVWQEIAKGRGAENFKARFAMELLPASVSASGEKRCVTLKGGLARLGRAKSYLEGFRVRAPMLLDNGEYLRIYEAATGLHISVETAQREAEPEAKETTDEIDATLDRTERFKIPEYMLQNHSTSVQETIQQIATSSGLARFDCPSLCGSSRYLRMTGTRKARDEARRLLQQGIAIYNNRTGSFHPSVAQLALAKNDLPPPTHVAWIQLPKDMTPLHKHEIQVLKRKTDTRFPRGLDSLDSTSGPVRVKGSEEGVDLAINDLKEMIERQREQTGAPIGDLEVLEMGAIADLGRDLPAGLSPDRAHDQQQAQPQIKEPPAPNVGSPIVYDVHTHYAWIAVPRVGRRSTTQYNALMHKVGQENKCAVGEYRRLNDAEGVVRVRGREDQIARTIDGLERAVNGVREGKGLPEVRLRVLDRGLLGDMPGLEAVRGSFGGVESVAVGEGSAGSREGDRARTEEPTAPNNHPLNDHASNDLIKSKSTHYLFLTLPLSSLPHKDAIAARGTVIRQAIEQSDAGWAYYYNNVSASLGLVKVLCLEEQVERAIGAVQRLADDCCEAEGRAKERVEVWSKGLIADMPDMRSVRQAFAAGKAVLAEGEVAGSEGEHDQAGIQESTAAPNHHTHFAWITLPQGSFPRLNKSKDRPYNTVAKQHDCFVRYYRLQASMLFKGVEENVKRAIADVERLINGLREDRGLAATALEIVKMGVIEDMPDLGTMKQCLRETAGAEVGSSKIATTGVQSQASGKELVLLEEHSTAAEPTHFAWVKLPFADRDLVSRRLKNLIKETFGTTMSPYQSIKETWGAFSLKGSEESIRHAVKGIPELFDAERQERRIPATHSVELEVLLSGRVENMPFASDMPYFEAFRDDPAFSRSHSASVQIPVDSGTGGRLEIAREVIKREHGCHVSGMSVTRTSSPSGQVGLFGNEASIRSAIDILQVMVVDAGQKDLGRPAAKIKIPKISLRGDLPAAAVDALHHESAPASATSNETTATDSVDRRSIAQLGRNTPEEQAKQVAPSSLSGYSYRSPTLASPQDSDAKRAEEQGARQTNEQLGENMRSALRHITQPVALVTSAIHEKNESEKMKLARGVTVSSFCTVTLQPVPIVSFNIRVPSRSWDAISESGHLRVHLLKATPEGAAAAHAFTLPYDLPHEPFRRLNRSGVFIGGLRKIFFRRQVPSIHWAEAIHAAFLAKILPEKCIQVGDHTIVVAEVLNVNLSDDPTPSDAGALAYGMKGYRQLGSEITPLELKPVEQEPVEAKPIKPEMVAEKEAASVGDESPSDSIGDVNSLFERFGAEPEAEEGVDDTTPAASFPDVARTKSPAEYVLSQSAIEALIERKVTEALKQQANTTFAGKAPAVSENEVSPAEVTPLEQTSEPRAIEDLGPSSPMLEDEALRQVLGESETEYSTKSLPSQTAAENPMLAEALNAVAGAYNGTLEDAGTSGLESLLEAQTSAADEKRSDKLEHAAAPDSNSNPETKTLAPAQKSDNVTHENNPSSVLSTVKRPWGVEDTSTPSIRRFQSRSTRHYSTSSPPSSTPHISKKILQMTVADYLCEVPTHRKRYAALVETQRGAERIEAALQDATQRENLSPEQIDSLETQALTARRKVARELALRNVDDLAAMLDRGRVDMVRAQWLESNLEAGQAVVLAEAKGLRRELEAGRLTVEGFESAKGALTRDYDVIDAQLRRLRDFVDDDGVEGEGDVEEFMNEVEEEERFGDVLGEEEIRETNGRK
jgi:flavin reductase (DIM6/NTAB) family NADH-FMN oxidoreductase RutF